MSVTTLLTLSAGESSLVLAPEIGGAVLSWTRGSQHIFRPTPQGTLQADSARLLACYPLVPFSNRVAKRRFTFEGHSYELPDLLFGWAIHGAGWMLPWQASSDGTTATLTLDYPGGPLWPFAFRAEQRWVLEPDRLDCAFMLENQGDAPFPAGLGLHPFFPRTSSTRLRFFAEGVWRNGPDMIPTICTPIPPEWDHRDDLRVGSAALDNCFTGWDSTATLLYPDRNLAVTITADPSFGHLVVYIPPGDTSFAVEPVSNMTDGFNRMGKKIETGVFVLQPGESKTGRIGFAVAPID
jgi:aldose 1-epimerase